MTGQRDDDDPVDPADVLDALTAGRGVPAGLVTDVHQLIVGAGYDVPLIDVVALVAFLVNRADPTPE